MKQDQALTFPSEFPVKVIGKTSDSFEQTVIMIFRKHAPNLKENALKIKPSGGGVYTSITITITATSQEQLDALYRELTKHPDVLMAL